MNIYLFCGCAVAAAAVNVILRRLAPEWAVLSAAFAGVLLLRAALAYFYPLVVWMNDISQAAEYGRYFAPAVKSLGVAAVTYMCCEICRDAGENGLASKVELCGKAAILLCGLPVIKDVFSSVRSFVGQ